MSPGERPWLLIDVDGVLNPFLVSELFDLFELAPDGWTGPPLNVQLTERHGVWLTALSDVFELAWATTWEHNANRLISPAIGLPDNLPVVPFATSSLNHRPGISFKSPSVASWVGGRAFVWLDDSLDDADVDWFGTLDGIGDHLLIPIDPLIGLQEVHCAEARRWAETRPSA